MWRSLAGQVGKEQQSLRACRNRRRLCDERLVVEARHVPPPSERTTGRERDGEQAVPPRDRVTEGVDPPGRIDRRRVGVREQHAARSDRARHEPVPGDRGPDRRGRVVAAPGRDRDAGREPELGRDARAERPCRLRALEHGRKPVARNAERVEDLLGPAPLLEIEEERPGGIGCIRRELTRQPVTDGVLRKQHVLDPSVRVRLLVSEPQDLGGLEPGERGVPGDLDEPPLPNELRDGLALLGGALVVPEQRRSDHLARSVEEHRAVHLAREPQPSHDVAAVGDLARRSRQHISSGPPPSRRVLLGPSGPRREQRVCGRGGRDDVSPSSTATA